MVNQIRLEVIWPRAEGIAVNSGQGCCLDLMSPVRRPVTTSSWRLADGQSALWQTVQDALIYLAVSFYGKTFLWPYLASCVQSYVLRVIVFCYVKLCRWVGGSGLFEQTYCPYFEALHVKREKKFLLEWLWIENESLTTSLTVANHSYNDSSLHRGRSESSVSPRCVLTSLNAASYALFRIQLLLFSWSVSNSVSLQFIAH